MSTDSITAWGGITREVTKKFGVKVLEIVPGDLDFLKDVFRFPRVGVDSPRVREFADGKA